MFDLIVLIFDTSINDEREVSQNETMAHAISEAVASIFLRLRKITLSFLERHNNSIVIAVEKKIVMCKMRTNTWKHSVRRRLFVCRCLLFVNRNINKPICFNGCVSATNKTLIQFRLSRRARCCYSCQMKNNILTQSWNCWDNRGKKERFYLFSAIMCDSFFHILFTRPWIESTEKIAKQTKAK